MTINTHVRICLIIFMKAVCIGDVCTIIPSPRRGILKFLVTRTFQPCKRSWHFAVGGAFFHKGYCYHLYLRFFQTACIVLLSKSLIFTRWKLLVYFGQGQISPRRNLWRSRASLYARACWRTRKNDSMKSVQIQPYFKRWIVSFWKEHDDCEFACGAFGIAVASYCVLLRVLGGDMLGQISMFECCCAPGALQIHSITN